MGQLRKPLLPKWRQLVRYYYSASVVFVCECLLSLLALQCRGLPPCRPAGSSLVCCIAGKEKGPREHAHSSEVSWRSWRVDCKISSQGDHQGCSHTIFIQISKGFWFRCSLSSSSRTTSHLSSFLSPTIHLYQSCTDSRHGWQEISLCCNFFGGLSGINVCYTIHAHHDILAHVSIFLPGAMYDIWLLNTLSRQ